jgi:hypothetical protein
MTNLSSFAELMKRATEEKRLREEAEAERKVREVAPLLSELFETVAKGKEKAIEIPGKDKILQLVTDLEEKVEEIQTKVDDPTQAEDVTLTEKKFLKLFNRLQADFQALKKHVESRPVYGSGGGSGEVRILRMDDLDSSGLQDGASLVWSASLNKFILQIPTSSDEEMPYAKRVDFITDDELYKGEAAVGSSESDPVWRIRKLTIGSDSDVTEVWAGGSAQYIHAWSDRLTLTYT